MLKKKQPTYDLSLCKYLVLLNVTHLFSHVDNILSILFSITSADTVDHTKCHTKNVI
jgi:hypothetical protein